MKTKILFVLLIFLSLAVYSQRQETKWDYPMKPGTEQWTLLRTGQQMRDACQIPEDVLKNLPTDKLAEICLKYPMRGDYVFFDDERSGIKTVINRFNGLTELGNRPSGTRALISIYKNYPVFNSLPEKTDTAYPLVFEIILLELLLADDMFINRLDRDELLDLLAIVKIKYSDKIKNNSVYGLSNIRKTMLLATIIIDKTSQKLSAGDKNTITQFITNYRRANAELTTETSKIISNYENN